MRLPTALIVVVWPRRGCRRPTLGNLSVDLGELGRREDGLAASEEAVGVYRQLAARWPNVYQPDLDRSMAVLAWLKDLGGDG